MGVMSSCSINLLFLLRIKGRRQRRRDTVTHVFHGCPATASGDVERDISLAVAVKSAFIDLCDMVMQAVQRQRISKRGASVIA